MQECINRLHEDWIWYQKRIGVKRQEPWRRLIVRSNCMYVMFQSPELRNPLSSFKVTKDGMLLVQKSVLLHNLFRHTLVLFGGSGKDFWCG